MCQLRVWSRFAIIAILYHIQTVFSSTLLPSRVSCDDVKLIVNLHNEMRRRIAQGLVPEQPKASNMMKLAWDDKLADIAQQWANHMKFKHNKNIHDNRFKHVGENLFVSWDSSPDKSPDWERALNEWFDENESYTFEPLVSDPETGHYTQMVWADTMYVGCGFSLYKKNGVLNKLYVCNYGPGGNIHRQYPYEVGDGCENLCCKSQCGRLYGNKC